MQLIRYSLILLLLITLAVWWWILGSWYSTNEPATYRWGEFLSGPTQQSTATPDTDLATSTRIIFTGDVFFGRDVEDGARQYGYEYPLALFRQPPFSQADATVINFEAPIPPTHQPTPHFGMRFSVATSAVPALQRAGVTHAGLANNHTGDFGSEGLAHTRQTLMAGGVQVFGDPATVGTSSVALVDTVQGPVALIGIHAVNAAPDMAEVRTVLTALPDDVTAVVAYMHWGNEYQEEASVLQQELATDLVAAGVDVVVGHHPHVVQNIAEINDAPIFYSLGNTVFDQYFSVAVQTGLVVTLEFTKTERFVHLHPVSSLGSRTRPYLMPARERARWLTELANQSDASFADKIRMGSWSW